ASPIVSLPPPLDQAANSIDTAGLTIKCFQRFRVERDGSEIELCRNRNGQTILRYLAGQPRHRVSLEALVEALWPDDDPLVGRHKLHVAVSALRRSLGDPTALIYADGMYQLNPRVRMHIDVDEFEAQFNAGRAAAGASMAEHYLRACKLYTGAFLSEDVY